MDFSKFLIPNPKHPSCPDIDMEYNQWAEEEDFELWIKDFPESQHETIRNRLEYIRKYTMQQIEFDGEGWFVSQKALNYYEHRDIRLKNSQLSEKEFYEFDILQEAIEDLGLSPEATFEFIVYLWCQLKSWLFHGNFKSLTDKLDRAVERMDERPNDKIELDIKVGGKHFKFDNDLFIKTFIASFLNADLVYKGCLEIGYPTKREIDYILVRILLRNLPIKHKKQKKGTFSQAERNFGLSVLWLTGELNHRKDDDPTDFCTKENNATFDKLMRDFKDMPLPFI